MVVDEIRHCIREKLLIFHTRPSLLPCIYVNVQTLLGHCRYPWSRPWSLGRGGHSSTDSAQHASPIWGMTRPTRCCSSIGTLPVKYCCCEGIQKNCASWAVEEHASGRTVITESLQSIGVVPAQNRTYQIWVMVNGLWGLVVLKVEETIGSIVRSQIRDVA